VAAKQHILLLNLGTPDHPYSFAVYRYLTQFLNDPRVIDLPAVIRWPLVNLLILPFRYRQSAKAYQKIWQEQGSPLLLHSLELKAALAQFMGADYEVELGMRYGKPSIKEALKKFSNIEQLTIVPLFPQYASAANGSALEETLSLLAADWNIPSIRIIPPFYAHPEFISAYAELIRNTLAHQTPDLLLLSYHGLPERHINKSACRAECDRLHACPSIDINNLYCYRAHCYATSKALAEALQLNDNQYQVAFQSRLGRTPWIKPYTDLLLPELIQQGVKHLAIACPSFVADCLETLEEINIRAREQWQSLGGSSFTFIPCLNATPQWVKALAAIVSSSESE
jgi:protoporphyrin/coproporphyrin ferrochelatase